MRNTVAPGRRGRYPRLLLCMLVCNSWCVAATGASATRLQAQVATPAKLFAAHSWQPPSPPPAVAAPTPPKAPPLPLKYMGRLEEDGRIAVFLQETGQPHPRVVRQGDKWGNYRVDEVTSTDMQLTYLPLNEPQRLLFGSAP